MKTIISCFLGMLLACSVNHLQAQTSRLDTIYPLRGFSIGLPSVSQAKQFTDFVEKELAPAGFNTLILRVDWNFDYQSHPELRATSFWKLGDVKSLVAVCAKHKIRIVPQINLLGHQSWASELGKLLEKYPDFDETPWVQLPEKYEWPNADGLYCKSYCPNHPDVHKVVFACVDELLDAFEASDFHAGMDEVFYIADKKCPRCKGLDPAEVFAAEVNLVRDHLAQSNRQLWIWGDRLIDGKQTGMGEWEASMNNTARALNLIKKDVVICDWHYERPDPTAVLFAMKGFDVLTCPWNRPAVTAKQLDDIVLFRTNSTPAMKARFKGFIQTIWTSFENFQKEYQSTENLTAKSSGNSYRKVKEQMAEKP